MSKNGENENRSDSDDLFPQEIEMDSNLTPQTPNPIPKPSLEPKVNSNSIPSSPDTTQKNHEPKYKEDDTSPIIVAKRTNKCIYILITMCILLLIYSSLGVTYILLGYNTDCSCSSIQTQSAYASNVDNVKNTTLIPSRIPTNSPTHEPTFSPTNFPTEKPTQIPTFAPTQRPSSIPTLSPTQKPSLQPTIDYSFHQNYIGDYKISLRDTNHSNWLLCDGSFIDPIDYPQLFNIIGYTFGQSSTLFALPDARDHVIGIDGNSNGIGTVRGNEEITLIEDNLPSHWHYVANGGACTSNWASSSAPYLAQHCDFNVGLYSDGDGNIREYGLKATANEPVQFRSGSVGSGTSINIMQPTVFAGNLFVYSD